MDKILDKISISYACDNNYYVLPLCTSIKSLTENSYNNVFLNIYVLHSKNKLTLFNKCLIRLLNKKKCKIHFVQIDDTQFENFKISQECQHTSIETYYRFILASYFNNIDKIIYLDCDTVVLSDILELFNKDVAHFYMAGVQDYSKEAFCKRLNLSEYVNAEVLGDSGLLIEPQCNEELINTYKKMYFDIEFKNKCSESSMKRAKNFSWKTMANIMYQTFCKDLRNETSI